MYNFQLNTSIPFPFQYLERKAGLHSAAELREENERTRQRESEMFARMSSSATGKGMETVHRDKTGKKRDFKVEDEKKREEEKKKQEENETFMEWGKG
jgi:pre-mRNA-splicing factor CWC26